MTSSLFIMSTDDDSERSAAGGKIFTAGVSTPAHCKIRRRLAEIFTDDILSRSRRAFEWCSVRSLSTS